MTANLRLEGFGVAFGDRVIIAEIDLEIGSPGVHVLLGPAGGGKSTLLRTLAGKNENSAHLRVWGGATSDGRALHDGAHAQGRRPTLVEQNVRLLAKTVRDALSTALPKRQQLTRVQQEQAMTSFLEELGCTELAKNLDREGLALSRGQARCLAIVQALLSDPILLMVDEPTLGLKDEDAEPVLDLLARVAQDRALLFVTHRQDHAQRLGGTLSLLAGGRLQETTPTASFFAAPTSVAGKSFVETGGCVVASPDLAAEALAENVVPPPPLPIAARAAVASGAGPRGFRWLIPGALGGCPRPGVVDDVVIDLAGLKRVGITCLITLEECERFQDEDLAPYGMHSIFFPVQDMDVPTIGAAFDLATSVERWLLAGEVIAFHCRAGMGRTGTMLAAQLVYRGAPGKKALSQVRSMNPRWVQSTTQEDFLVQFEEQLPSGGHLPTLSRSAPKERENVT